MLREVSPRFDAIQAILSDVRHELGDKAVLGLHHGEAKLLLNEVNARKTFPNERLKTLSGLPIGKGASRPRQ